jgi:RHS repeat-associated protein
MGAQIRTMAGQAIADIGLSCQIPTDGWQFKADDLATDLAPYAGQQVQLVFFGLTDSYFPSTFHLSDVRLSAIPAGTTTAPPTAAGYSSHLQVRAHPARHTGSSAAFHAMDAMTMTNSVSNGDFEGSTLTPWTAVGSNVGLTTSKANGGTKSYRLCGVTNSCVSSMLKQQTTTAVPMHAVAQATLTFWYQIDTVGSPSPATANCIRPEIGSTYSTTICGDTGGAWKQAVVDVTSLITPGSTPAITLQSYLLGGGSGAPSAYIDDVALNITSFALTTDGAYTPPTGAKSLIENGSFASQAAAYPWQSSSATAGAGQYFGYLYGGRYGAQLCGTSSCNGQFTQSFVVPKDYSQLTLTYAMGVQTQETAGTCTDPLTIQFRTTSGAMAYGASAYCSADAVSGWVTQTIDVSSGLAAYKGQQVQLVVSASGNDSIPTTYNLTGMALYATGSTTPPLWTGGTSTTSGAPGWWTFQSIDLGKLIGLQVNTANGNLVTNVAGPSLPGVNGFDESLPLVYNSGSRGTHTDLGYGWGFDTGRDAGLDLSVPNQVTYHDGTGYQATFVKSGGVYSTPAGMDDQLTQSGSTYTLTDNTSGEVDAFDANGYLISQADRQGNRLEYSYNFDGTPSYMRNTEAQVTPFTTGSTGVSQITDPASRTWSYGYDGASTDNLTTVQIPGVTGSVGFQYDSNHNLTQITDPRGNVTTIAYIGSGSSSQVASITRITSNGSYTWTFTYNTGSTQVKDPNNHTTTYAYDGSSRVTSVTDATSKTTQYTWTADNHQATVALPSGATTTYTYDTKNNLTRVALPTGAHDDYTYTNVTYPYLPATATDMQGHTTTYTYIAPGLVQVKQDAAGKTTTFSYNSDGTLSRVTNPNSGFFSFSYNSLGLRSQVTYPAPLGAVTCLYTASDQCSQQTDGKNQTTSFGYTAWNEVSSEAPPGLNPLTYSYDGAGNLTSMTDPNGTTGYQYNQLNQEVLDTLPKGQTISYSWDGAGNLLSKTTSNGTANYTYTGRDELSTASVPGAAQLLTSFTYDQDGNHTLTTYPNGIKENMTYDTAGHLTRIWATNSGGTTLNSYAYTYTNASGQATDLRQTMLTATGASTSYSYDVLNRLKSAMNGTTGYTYNYDSDGNLTGAYGPSSGIMTAAYNTADQATNINGIAISYDANGNATTATTGDTLAYNSLDQTTADTSGGNTTAALSYAGDDETDIETSGATGYQSDLTGVDQVSLTINGTPTTIAVQSTPAGKAYGEVVQGSAYYFLFDGNGSVVAVTDGSSQSVDNTYSYDPYGNIASSTGTAPNPFGFADSITDDASGLDKMGARFYDPLMGRFTQTDPAFHPCSETGQGTGNLYGYADDDPVNNTDPTGLKSQVNWGSPWGGGKGSAKGKHRTSSHKKSLGIACAKGAAIDGVSMAIGGAIGGAVVGAVGGAFIGGPPGGVVGAGIGVVTGFWGGLVGGAVSGCVRGVMSAGMH